MMRIHHYHSEDDDYFNEYADTIKYEVLKDRLHWQHKLRKDIQLEYRFFDDDCDFDFWCSSIYLAGPKELGNKESVISLFPQKNLLQLLFFQLFP